MTVSYELEENALRRKYTRQYLFAMGLVVGAIVLGAVHITKVLELNRLGSEVVSTASAQYAVAQRLVLLPDRVATENNVYSQSRVLDAISEAVGQMRAGHDYLMNGADGIAPPAEATDHLRQLYSLSGQRLDRDVTRFLDAYEQYLSDPDENSAAISLVRVNAENFLLISLARAAELHAEADKAQMADAIMLHRIWIAIALGLAVVVVVFVLRPLARNAAKAVVAISAERDEGAALLSRSLTVAKMGHWRTSDRNGDTIWLSREIIDLLDLDVAERYQPLSILQLDPLNDATGSASCPLRQTWTTGQQTVFKTQFTKSNGEIVDLVVHLDAERDANGEVVGVVGVVKDDTAEAEADRALQDSYEVIERKSHDLVEAQRLGKLATWRELLGSTHVAWDDSAYQLMGMDPETFDTSLESVGKCYVDDGWERVVALKQKVIETGEPQSGIVQARRGDGALIDLHIRFKLERDENNEPVAVFGIMQDVSKERAAARELEKLAYFDELTGLSNRTLFTRELRRIGGASDTRDHEAALLLIDLDHFKEVNDTLGHQAGDQLLGIVAHRLSMTVGNAGFVARLGGDEFAVIVEKNVSKEALDRLCDDIIDAVSVPASLSLGTVQTNASIGIALSPEHSCKPEDLLSFADLALYSSKEQGRGRASYYDPTYSDALGTRISLGKEIRAALKESRFEAHFQPIVDARSETVTRFEALLRLPKEDGGFIPPSEFIPIAESSHLIADLGALVLHQSCEEAQSWLDAGLPRRMVSVNVSAAQLWHGDLEKVIDSALSSSGLDPKLLCIELTESVFVADSIERLEGILCRLKDRGIQLALDDFGTGYSSLGYLNRLPFDNLKIDRMFVSNAHASAEKRKMLRGVISLAKGLNLKVTAEGVETAEELKLVRDLGCDHIQGWYFGKALPSDQAMVEASRIDAKAEFSEVVRGELASKDAPLRTGTSLP